MTIPEIKNSYNIDEVIGKHIPGGLQRQGSQWVGNCPFHDDHHASLKVSVSKNLWKCFVTTCGKGGDMFDFFTEQGKTLKEACEIITGDVAISPAAAVRVPKPAKKWINAIPDQNAIPDPLKLSHPNYNTNPVAAWAYHNTAGHIIGFTCRFDLPAGKKDVLPYSFKQQISEDGTPLGNAIWKWGELDKPRPLYNLHEITARPTAIILMVEGEKTADAAKRLFPQYVCTTWIGGSDNVTYTDFSPLKGRNVFLWNDNDLAGILCMFGGWEWSESSAKYKRITGIVELVEANFKRIQNSQDFPKKWDVADATWTPAEAKEYLLENRVEIPSVSEFPPNELPIAKTPEPVAEPKAAIPAKPVVSEPEDDMPKNPYFKCLGFENNDQNLYVFFVYRTNVIVKLSAGGISVSNLLQLAPLNYWEGKFPKSSRSGGVKFEINTVADYLINVCSRLGIFNPNKIRGRGAWKDGDDIVIHCGDTLIVNGKYVQFSKYKTKFIYEAGQELGFSLVKPLSKVEANKLVKILERLNWAREIDSRLLAGWIVIAPLCGALNWRSHFWLTGASGTGKSWIMKNLIKKLLGQMFVDAQGATTEAGIRQYLKADALAVVFDEAESENKKNAERIQSVLELMRASSTSDGGKIIKGSSGGSAAQFDIRSCFAFASIANELTQRSDFSRITTAELKKDESDTHKEKWQETLALYSQTISEAFVQGFQSRSVSMLPIILKNAETFSNAAAAELDNQRTGDQLGALLAGAYSLTSDSLISFEDARKWIKERDWSEERLVDGTRDEVKVINRIMDADTQVETVGYGKATRTIGELILTARGDNNNTNPQEEIIIPKQLADMTLRRLGLKVEGRAVVFSDNSEYIRRVLSNNNAYSRNYHIILARCDGAEKLEPTTFASGTKSRAVKIDSAVIFGETETAAKPQHETDSTKTEATQGDLFKK